MSVSRQAIILFVATGGMIDDVPLEKVSDFMMDFVDEMQSAHDGDSESDH